MTCVSHDVGAEVIDVEWQFGMSQRVGALSTRSLSEEGLVRGRKYERE